MVCVQCRTARLDTSAGLRFGPLPVASPHKKYKEEQGVSMLLNTLLARSTKPPLSLSMRRLQSNALPQAALARSFIEAALVNFFWP